MAKSILEDKIDKTVNDKFLDAVKGMQWAETSDIVELLDRVPGFWDNAVTLEEIKNQWKKNFVRRKIKQIRENGIPLFASIETTNEEGETVRVYKREDAFNTEDFRKTATYYGESAKYNAKMAVHYAGGYERQTGLKMMLPFNPDCFVD